MELGQAKNLPPVSVGSDRSRPPMRSPSLIRCLPCLDVAHAAAIHRDIKPSNILLLQHDGLVRLADFDIAPMPDELTSALTTTG